VHKHQLHQHQPIHRLTVLAAAAVVLLLLLEAAAAGWVGVGMEVGVGVEVRKVQREGRPW
jgi:hypothetical protein